MFQYVIGITLVGFVCYIFQMTGYCSYLSKMILAKVHVLGK